MNWMQKAYETIGDKDFFDLLDIHIESGYFCHNEDYFIMYKDVPTKNVKKIMKKSLDKSRTMYVSLFAGSVQKYFLSEINYSKYKYIAFRRSFDENTFRYYDYQKFRKVALKGKLNEFSI